MGVLVIEQLSSLPQNEHLVCHLMNRDPLVYCPLARVKLMDPLLVTRRHLPGLAGQFSTRPLHHKSNNVKPIDQHILTVTTFINLWYSILS
jgi:hypothetical protein